MTESKRQTGTLGGIALALLLFAILSDGQASELRAARYDAGTNTIHIEGWVRPTHGGPALAWIARHLQGTSSSPDRRRHWMPARTQAGVPVFAYDPATRTARCSANIDIEGILSLGVRDWSYDPLKRKGQPDETLLFIPANGVMPSLKCSGMLIAYESLIAAAPGTVRLPAIRTKGTFRFEACRIENLTGFVYGPRMRVYLERCVVSGFRTLLADHWASWSAAVMHVRECRLEHGDIAFFLYHSAAQHCFEDISVADCKHTFVLLGQGRVAAVDVAEMGNQIRRDKRSASALYTQHWLRVSVQDRSGAALAGQRVQLKVTDAKGVVEFAGPLTADALGGARLALTEKVESSDGQCERRTPHLVACVAPPGAKLRLGGAAPTRSVRVDMSGDRALAVILPKPARRTPHARKPSPEFQPVRSGGHRCFGVLKVTGRLVPGPTLVVRACRDPVVAAEYTVDFLDLLTSRRRLRADIQAMEAQHINTVYINWSSLDRYAAVVPELVEEFHHAGMLVFGFALHCRGVAGFVARHPDLWLVDDRARPARGQVCLNRPAYHEFLSAEIRAALLDRGLAVLDGVQIDEPGYPLRQKSWKTGEFYCYCDYCRREFLRQFGFPMPRPAERKTRPERWRKLIRFRQQTMARWLQVVCDAVRTVAPHATTQVNFIPEINSTWQHKHAHYTVGEGYSIAMDDVCRIRSLDNVQIDPYWGLWHRRPEWLGDPGMAAYYVAKPQAAGKSAYYWIQAFEGEGSTPLAPGEVTRALHAAFGRGVNGVILFRYGATIRGKDGTYSTADYMREFTAAVAPYCGKPVKNLVIRIQADGQEKPAPAAGRNGEYRIRLPPGARHVSVTLSAPGLKPAWRWSGNLDLGEPKH